MQLKQKPFCPHCHSEYTQFHCGSKTVKHTMAIGWPKPQNHKCKSCNRQFVERCHDPVEEYKERELLPALLLERISLHGVGRVLKHGLSWVYARMEKLWEQLPEDLPVGRLKNADIGLYCLEADEMWGFVGAKDCPEWLWLAMERRTGLVVSFHVGGRDEEGAQGLLWGIPGKLLERSLVFTDGLATYGTVFKKGQLQQEGKPETTKIERFNCTVRQRCSRLVRKSLSFSRKWENHYLAIKYFLVNHNLAILAKNPSLL